MISMMEDHFLPGGEDFYSGSFAILSGFSYLQGPARTQCSDSTQTSSIITTRAYGWWTLMTKVLSNFSLLVLNLWISLCRGVRGLPSAIHDLGYQDRAIERRFENQDLESVHPELIIASRRLGHTILFEFKAGANTDADQLRRYSRVTSRDLEQRVYLEAAEVTRHDVAVIGKEENRERLMIGIREEGHTFPLIVADDQGLELVLSAFSEGSFDAVMRPRFDFDWAAVSMAWVPFDHGSDLWEIAEVIIPQVLKRMRRREPRIEARSVCAEVPSWDCIGPPERNQMQTKVSAVMREAAHHEFRDYFRFRNDGIDVTNNPLELGVGATTPSLRRLRRLQRDFITRLEGGQLEFEI